MVILIIGIILYAIIAFGTICIMIGGNLNKSEYEKQMEDEEQIKYLREYKNRRNSKWKKSY